MGRVYGRQGKWRKAYANYVRSVWLAVPDPKNRDYVRMKQKYNQITSLHKQAVQLDLKRYILFLWLGAELYKADWTYEATAVIGTAALMQPRLELYMMIGELYTAEMYLNEAIDNYKEGIRKLSGRCSPDDLAPMYEALVMNLADCNRTSEAEKYAIEAISVGAEGPKLRKHRALAKDQIDGFNPLEGGWISPSYVDSRLRIKTDGRIVSI